MNFLWKDKDTDSIQFLPSLANLFKNSIEHLYLDEDCHSFMKLPFMPQLESLKLDIPVDFDSKSVNLNKLFPALKKLELDSFDTWNYDDFIESEWEELLPNSEPCPNVNSLSLRSFTMRIQLFDHILNIFPKLTKIVLQVTTDGAQILRRIMTEMTQLEDLSVCGRIEGIENIDAFYTGIPVQKVQELEHVVTELKEMTAQLRADTIQHYRTRYSQFPFIANLTNLKRLWLDTIGRSGEANNNPLYDTDKDTRMTDVLAYFGLYSMKHINKLEINDCEFTKGGCEILTTEMGLETWTFTSEDYKDYIVPNKWDE